MKVGDVLYNKNPIHKFLWFYRGETEKDYMFDILTVNTGDGFASYGKGRFIPWDNFENVKKNLVALDSADYIVVFDTIFLDINVLEKEAEE